MGGRQLTLFLRLFLGGLIRGSATSSSTCTSSSRRRSSTTTRANVQQKLLDILALEGFGEEGAPNRLDIGDLGSGDDGLKFVGL